MNEEDQLVAVGDETPPIKEQARLLGWKADLFDFGKAEEPGIAHFNPGLVRRPDGLWLLVRRSAHMQGMTFGMNGIWACKLGDNLSPIGGPLLAFPDSKSDEQFEDPRAVYWNGQTWVACVNFTWYADSTWTGAHQMLGVFRDDPEWTALARRDPSVMSNKPQAGHTDGIHQKNWLWWFIDGKLFLLYNSDPWIVIEFGSKWDEQTQYVGDAVRWKYGHVRGGTPPVLVGDRYYTFFHSSMPWRAPFRRYHMGALAFESTPPFKPVLWTQDPLLSGSQNDPWQQRKPLVVFPCGAIYENERWLISLGVNDLRSAWVEIPHEDVLARLNPAPIAPATALLGAATVKPEFEPMAFLDDIFDEETLKGGDADVMGTGITPKVLNAAPTSKPEGAAEILEKKPDSMAKARAALAEKRRLGTVQRKPKRKRRKRVKRKTLNPSA